MEIKNHFGVYGVCLQEGKLLCIEKTRGPYQNTLSRYSNPRIYDVMVQEGGQDFAVHHIMAFYDIVLDFERSQKSLPQEVLDGSNDSANAIWIPFEQITEKNASPLVLKVKAELVGFPELELTSYINWKTKEG